MATIDILSQKISFLKDNLTQIKEENLDEKTKLEAQVAIIDGCINAMSDDSLIANYDFSNAIQLVEKYNYSIENLTQIVSDIQNVISIREELEINAEEMPLEENQTSTFNTFMDKLKKLKAELEEEIKQISSQTTENSETKKKISDLESLKNILEGTGKRKYYTEDMFMAFYDEFDPLSLPLDQVEDIIDDFYKTRNLSGRQRKEKANFSDVEDLYSKFLSDTYMSSFERLLNEYKNEVVTVIDFDNTTEILQFFKEKGILESFVPTALLKISLYGKSDYIKDVIYPKIQKYKDNEKKAFYEDALATIWIKEKGETIHRATPFRRSRGSGESSPNESLYASSHTVDYDEFIENIEILKQNANLFDFLFNPDDLTENLNIKILPTWVLKKNIELCKLFGLGSIKPIPITCIEKGDIEDKIHLAIELGLLNPPMTDRFNLMDKDIPRNDSFVKNVKKQGAYCQSIRNYFQRYLSKLSNKSINEYALLAHKLQKMGYSEFYKFFFSDNQAGMASTEHLTLEEKSMMSNTEDMSVFMIVEFMNDWYPENINDYDEYDSLIAENNDEAKEDEFIWESYIDNSIYNEALIQELEEKHCVMDTLTVYDPETNETKEIQKKNEYVYMFGDRIISRYKVLHNASVLKNNYGYLNEDMLLTCIVRNSFLDKETFESIKEDVLGKGSMK